MAHTNSLANLRPPWKAGESGNPAGRFNAGFSLIEWIHELAAEDAEGNAKYTDADLLELNPPDPGDLEVDANGERVVGDGAGADVRAPRMKRIAARLLLLATTAGFHERTGKAYCAELVDMLLDRTVGKPTQRVEVEHKPALMPADADDRVLDLLDRTPGMADGLRRLLAEHDRRHPIDTTATPTLGPADRK